MSKYSFYLVAWAAHFNCIINKRSSKIFTWEPDYLILPIVKDLIRYFRSREYQREVQNLTREYHFIIDHSKLTKKMKNHNLESHINLLN